MAISDRSGRFSAIILTAAAGVFGSCFLTGCGGSPSPSSTAVPVGSNGVHPKPAALPTESSGPPAVAESAASPTSGNQQNVTQASASDIPKEGSPEWLIGQMLVLRGAQLPSNERDQKLVEIAHEVIAKTHKDKSRQAVFDKAVQFLAEARLRLATGGSQEDAKALYDDAKALYTRDPSSAAAAEGAYAVARLAHHNARQFGRSDTRYIQQFAIQARLFASRFASDARAAQLLCAAGQSCELYLMDAEALNCYTMLQDRFSKTPQADLAAAVLRRLNLKGKRLDLGGETSDGGFVKLDQFRGKPTLIVFWSSDCEPFQAILPKLQRALEPYDRSELAILGVCLDESESEKDSFIEKNHLNWTQIFYADQSKRQWENPLVQYYGLHDIPAIWLVNADGVVVDTHVTAETVGRQLKYLVAGNPRSTPQ